MSEQLQKRGRGRPKKNPQPQKTEIVADFVESAGTGEVKSPTTHGLDRNGNEDSTRTVESAVVVDERIIAKENLKKAISEATDAVKEEVTHIKPSVIKRPMAIFLMVLALIVVVREPGLMIWALILSMLGLVVSKLGIHGTLQVVQATIPKKTDVRKLVEARRKEINNRTKEESRHGED